MGDGTGEKKGWIPGLNWNGNRKGWDEGDVRGGGKVGDVRGERVLEADFEGDVMEEEEEEDGDEGEDGEGEGKDVEMDARWSGSNVRDMFLRVWKEVERIGMVVRRRRRVETAEELDDGHDGDL